jgi:hypothetical protein
MSTNTYKKAVTDVSTAEVLLCFVTLSHPNWSEPIKIVNNNVAINDFIPYGFSFKAPKPATTGEYTGEIEIDNTDRYITKFIRDETTSISVEVYYALASTPTQIEFGPFFLQMKEAQISGTITAKLSKETVLDNQLTGFLMDVKTFPGLKFVV